MEETDPRPPRSYDASPRQGKESFDEILSAIDGIEQYQVIITKKNELDPYSPDRIIIKIGLEEKVIEIDDIIHSVVSKMKSYTDLTPEVEVESPKKIFDGVMEKMKGQRVVDKRGEIKKSDKK